MNENELRKTVEKEIEQHGKTWCSPNCVAGNTFLPAAYRAARTTLGYSSGRVQGDYDLCHIFR